MTDASLRFRNILQPVIVPVVDDFALIEQRKLNGLDCAVVAHPFLKDTNEACRWMENKLGGRWLVPTLHIAGEEWKLNPKPSLEGWRWLLIKA
jgi:hypothetical protein